MKKAVVFDMDGVLVDSEPFHFMVEKRLFEAVGINPTEEECKSFIGLSCGSMWGYLKTAYNLSQSVDELVLCDKEMRSQYFLDLKGVEPIEGVVELLKKAS